MEIKPIIKIWLLFCLLAIPVMGEGFTVKSISSIPVISNNETLSRANINLDLVADGGGQSIVGQWGSGEVSKFIPIIASMQPLKISIGDISERLSYPILNQGAIYHYSSYYKDAPGSFSGAECEPAPSLCYAMDTPRFGVGFDRVLIVDRVRAASFGYLGNPDISWHGGMTISINGTPYTQSIGSGEDARGSIRFNDNQGEWIANVLWVGSLVTGQATPNQDNFISTKTDTNAWQVSPKASYEKYTKSLSESDTLLQIKEEEPYLSENPTCKDDVCSSILNIITVHNEIVQDLLSKNVRIDYGSVTSDIQQNINNGNVITVLNRNIGYPELIVTLRASNLGIEIKTGIPQIEYIDAQDVASGDNTGYIKATVKNTGEFQGTFIGNISGSHESQKITLSPGETGDIVLFVNDTVEGIRAGVLTVYDINSGAEDTKEYQINVTQAKAYIPNSKVVFDDVVQQAANDGMSSENVLDCSDGIFQMTANGYDCISLENAKIEEPKKQVLLAAPIPTSNPANAPKDNTLLYLWIAVIILGVLFLGLILYKILSIGSRTQKKAIRAALWGIAVVVILVVSLWYLVPLLPTIKSGIDEMLFIKNIYEKVKL